MNLRRAALLTVVCVTSTFAQAAERPNFLLIIADDLTWRDLGYEGNQDVHTPNLDKLREESMLLTRMFTPATTCSPSRHALYTGLFCVRSGAYPNHTMVRKGTKSVFSHLKQAGYRVALQNKSHVKPKASFPYEHINVADDLTETLAFVERDANQPWLLAYASNDPHGKWSRGPQELYAPEKIAIPPYLHDNATTRQLLAAYYAEVTQLDTQVGNLMTLLKETRQTDNTVVVFFSEQGSSFPYGGKWSLYDNGIRASTLVRWPGHVQPGSTCDALVQYVDVAPTLLEAAGVVPTTVDAGCPDANGQTGFDGRSMMSLLAGEATTFRDYVFSQHTTVGIHGYQEPYPMRAVRDARYKLIRNLASQNTYAIGGIHKNRVLKSWAEDARDDPQLAQRVEWMYKRPAEELYDLEADEYETHNLADDPQFAEIKARLQAELDKWMEQQGDLGMETELAAKSRQPRQLNKNKPKTNKRPQKNRKQRKQSTS